MVYVSRRPPRVRQAEALDAVRGREAFAIRMAQRTGKSKVLIDDFGRMVCEGRATDMIVIAPGGAYRTWPAHLATELPDHVLSSTKILLWQSDRAKTRQFRYELEDFLGHRGPRVLVMNIEAISTVAAARLLCTNFLDENPGCNVVAVDESVKIKNHESACGEFVVEQLRPKAAFRRILTGRITPRSPLDLWNQFRFLDPSILGHEEFTTFRARYAKMRRVCMLPRPVIEGKLRSRLYGGDTSRYGLIRKAAIIDPDLNVGKMSAAQLNEFIKTMADVMPRDKKIEVILALGGHVQTIPIIDGYDHVDELAAKIAPHSYRCRLEDCYDMPPSSWSRWDVPWHPEQRRVYEDIRATATAELESMDHVTATHVVVRMLRLHQVLCGHVVDEEKKIHDVPERRTQALLDCLEDYEGRAVIWCSYDHSVRRVTEALKKEYGEGSVARFWGGNADTREADEARFREDPECRFMIATPDAGRYGRDWREADMAVYYSSRNDLDHRDQSEERVKAVDKTRPVAYVDLRVPGTVDDKIIDCLREKIDMAAMIDGDEWRRWVV